MFQTIPCMYSHTGQRMRHHPLSSSPSIHLSPWQRLPALNSARLLQQGEIKCTNCCLMGMRYFYRVFLLSTERERVRELSTHRGPKHPCKPILAGAGARSLSGHSQVHFCCYALSWFGRAGNLFVYGQVSVLQMHHHLATAPDDNATDKLQMLTHICCLKGQARSSLYTLHLIFFLFSSCVVLFVAVFVLKDQ